MGRETVAIRDGPLTAFLDLRDGRMSWAVDELVSEKALTTLIRARLRPGDAFVDIGANHGIYAIHAAGVVGVSGVVIAFEPQKRLADLVRQSLNASHAGEHDVIEAAVGSHTGQAQLESPQGSHSGQRHLRAAESCGEDPEKSLVRVVRLDDEVDLKRLQGRHVMIKIDVEGAESEVLQGAETLVRQQVDLVVECCDGNLRRFGSSSSALINQLSSLCGRRPRVLNPDGTVGDEVSGDETPPDCDLVLLSGDR